MFSQKYTCKIFIKKLIFKNTVYKYICCTAKCSYTTYSTELIWYKINRTASLATLRSGADILGTAYCSTGLPDLKKIK